MQISTNHKVTVPTDTTCGQALVALHMLQMDETVTGCQESNGRDWTVISESVMDILIISNLSTLHSWCLSVALGGVCWL